MQNSFGEDADFEVAVRVVEKNDVRTPNHVRRDGQRFHPAVMLRVPTQKVIVPLL